MKILCCSILSVFLTTFYSSGELHAQNELDPNKTLDQYIYDSWSSQDGLPVNSVLQIIQAKNGYIWFVSYGGITRFNGIDFYTYSSFNTPEIQNNSYTDIYEDQLGVIWASSSGGGVTSIDGDDVTLYTTSDGLPTNFVQEIVADADGKLWVATSNGLYYKKGNRFFNEETLEELKQAKLTSIDYDQDDYMWVGTVDHGVYKLNKGAIAQYHTENGLVNNHVNSIELVNGKALIGTDGGISIIDGNRIRNITEEDGLPNNHVTSSLLDDNGILWIGSYRGFTRIKGNNYSYFSNSHPLYEQDITSMVKDNEGNLWLGTYRQGLYKMWDGKFTNYSDIKSAGQKPYVVHSIIEKQSNEYLIVHQTGVSMLDPVKNTIKPFDVNYDLSATNLKSGFIDSDGNLWICTLNFLLKYKNGRSEVYNSQNGLIHDNVRLVFEDSQKNIWVGTTNGITVMREEGYINYSVADGLSHAYIMSISEDSDGNIWIGTRSGLNLYKDGKFTSFYANDGLAGDFVFKTFEDSDGVMWVCGNAGLTRYKDGEFEKVLATDGMASNTIFQILEDEKGYFWFTTNQKGISLFKVHKEDLNNFIEGKISEVHSIAYSQDDGLKSTAATSSSTSLKASNGTLLFATNSGVEMIDPLNIKKNLKEPPVVIEEILINNNIHRQGKESSIVIPSGRNRVTIKFAALSYIASESITYKYKLKGYDDKWHETNEKKEISYTNLPYGDYVFHVLAANRDGVWNEEGVVLPFYIKPSFYETRAFVVALVLLTVFLGWMVYNWRIRALKSARQELSKTVAVRTSEILHQKEEIEAQKEAIEAQQKQIEDKNTQLQKINIHLEDIVEERTDQLRKAYKELLKVNKELDNFIYRSVHDVRGPIARLQGLSHLISLETHDKKILELVTLLNGTADEMNDVFYRLLNIVRLRAAELNINKVPIAKVIDQVLEKLLLNEKDKAGVEVYIEPNFELFSDRETIENIFYQLLDNAIKFKRRDKTFRIEIRCSRMTGNFVCITVTDYGIGIPISIADKVFDMFFVGHDEIRGSGLGLYTVKTAVKVLNGKIRLLNEEEKTTFELIFPANIG